MWSYIENAQIALIRYEYSQNKYTSNYTKWRSPVHSLIIASRTQCSRYMVGDCLNQAETSSVVGLVIDEILTKEK